MELYVMRNKQKLKIRQKIKFLGINVKNRLFFTATH